MTDTVKATGYLQVEPEWSRYPSTGGRDSPGNVIAAKLVALTQKRSRQPRPGTVEIAVTIEIPKSAFVPLRPEATIVIPADMVIPHPVVVEASDPNAD